MQLEHYHEQGKLHECVYVGSTHLVTCLGAMTLIVVIIALTVCLFASYHKKQ